MKRLVLIALLSGCTDGSEHAQSTCVLFDESGTYSDQRDEAARIIRTALLPGMLPGDHLILGLIDSKSYERANIVTTLHLEQKPSRVHAQKLAFLKELETFAARTEKSRHTDIRGAMMLCSEHLIDSGAANRTMLIFSDMTEELPKGVARKIGPEQFRGISILAMNVKKLERDNSDPTRYRERLDHWNEMVRAGGANRFDVVVAPEKLVAYLEQAR